MKSYLSLIPISAHVHRRQNRMTLFCIIISVFLVTAIFSMADMGIRMEGNRLIKEHGNWHIMLKNIPKSDAELIGSRSDVAAASWYDVINYKINEDYYIGGKKAALCGVEEPLVTDMMNCLTEGNFPRNNREIVLTDNVKNVISINIGDAVTVNTPSGSLDYTVSGFAEDTSSMLQYDAVGAFMDLEAFDKVCSLNGNTDSEPVYYVQFKEHTNIRKTIADMKQQYGWTDDNISENAAVLGIKGFSSNSYIMGFYLIAAVLCVLILAAGALMIAGSINSNVAERSQFFGMLRCIGASRQQIIRFVRLEALNWCKTAVPAGVALGILITWGLCAVLRFGIGGEFEDIPLFGVSLVGIICGIVMGILTVLLAAQSPAKHAAKTSPMAAVSGNAKNSKNVRHAANTRFCKIETSLGVHHAVSAKKNLILMTGSFALSIILFLGFSALLDWTHHAINPLRPYAPDLSIMSSDRACSVDRDMVTEINGETGVKRVFGRMFSGSIPAVSDKNIDKIDLISYEEYQFDWAEEDVVSGDLSKVTGDSDYVMTVYDKSNPLEVGDIIKLDSAQLEVACVLSDSPFSSTDTPTVICSEETFTRLTGERDYAVIDIQLTGNASDTDVNAIRDLAGAEYLFSDRRETNRETTGTYWAFSLLVYGFLAIIALIAVFNIINSISMSVSARIKQYGAMRAVGMDVRQIIKMIAAETVTYALSGCIVGCGLGLPLNRFLFENLVTDYWGDAWTVPGVTVAVILLIMVLSSVAAVYNPSKRIRNMAITDTINEL